MLVVSQNEQLPVKQAKAGEPEAWNALFKRYQLPLYVYVYELVHDEQGSLDIVQETFARAARYIGGLREEEKFGSWLFGIAHQRCVQQQRDRHRRLFEEPIREDESFEYEEDGLDPAETLIRREQEEALMRMLDRLPLEQRSVLLLYFMEAFSLEEIAEITATQLGTVKSRMHYAKKTLKTLLEENNENPA
jgi:RNA polymerase sigma-70 factor (ECF subfamily)